MEHQRQPSITKVDDGFFIAYRDYNVSEHFALTDDKPYHDDDHAGIAGKFIPDLQFGDETAPQILDIRIEGTYAQQARLEFVFDRSVEIFHDGQPVSSAQLHQRDDISVWHEGTGAAVW